MVERREEYLFLAKDKIFYMKNHDFDRAVRVRAVSLDYRKSSIS